MKFCETLFFNPTPGHLRKLAALLASDRYVFHKSSLLDVKIVAASVCCSIACLRNVQFKQGRFFWPLGCALSGFVTGQ